jgi:regulator of RNase E activity RraA
MEINGPISIAGVRVNPGDLIIADDSGVVVVPGSKAEEVLEKTIHATKREEAVVRLFESGASIEEISSILPPSKW